MVIKLARDVRRVIVLGGEGHGHRRVYSRDRDDDDDDRDIAITVIKRDNHGRLVARERYETDGTRRKKQSRLLRPIERILRRGMEFETRLMQDYLDRHNRSNAKRRNGWARDLRENFVKAVRRSKPRRIIRGK